MTTRYSTVFQFAKGVIAGEVETKVLVDMVEHLGGLDRQGSSFLVDLFRLAETEDALLNAYEEVAGLEMAEPEISITEDTGGYNNRRHGKPWIAKVTGWEGHRANMEFGAWIGDPGSVGMLEINAKPGDIVRIGQKDYRRPDRSRDDWYVVSDEITLEEVSKVEARQYWKRRTA